MMVACSLEKQLLVYLTITEDTIIVLLAQEHDGQEKLVYYLSLLLKGPEQNYSFNDKLSVALMYVVQKFRHYLITHSVRVIINSDPIKLLIQKPILTGGYAKQMVMLRKLEILVKNPKAIKS